MFKNLKVVGSVLLILSFVFVIIGLSIFFSSDMAHAQAEYEKYHAKYSEWQAVKVEARKAANERGQKTSEAIEIAQEQVDHYMYWALEWQSDINVYKTRATTCFVIGALSTVAGIVAFSLSANHKEIKDDGGALVDTKIVKMQ